MIYYSVILRLFTSTNAFDTYQYFVGTLISSVVTAALVTVVVEIVVEALEELLMTMVLLIAETGSDLSNSSVTGIVLLHHDIANDNSRGNGSGGISGSVLILVLVIGPMGQRSKTTAKAGFSVFIKTTH